MQAFGLVRECHACTTTAIPVIALSIYILGKMDCLFFFLLSNNFHFNYRKYRSPIKLMWSVLGAEELQHFHLHARRDNTKQGWHFTVIFHFFVILTWVYSNICALYLIMFSISRNRESRGPYAERYFLSDSGQLVRRESLFLRNGSRSIMHRSERLAESFGYARQGLTAAKGFHVRLHRKRSLSCVNFEWVFFFRTSTQFLHLFV